MLARLASAMKSTPSCNTVPLVPGNACKIKKRKYTVIKRLGEGAHGNVYLVEDKEKVSYALKRFSDTPDDIESHVSEVYALTSLKNNPSIIDIFDTQTAGYHQYPTILLQYVNGGDLTNFINENVNKTKSSVAVDLMYKLLYDIGVGLQGLNFEMKHMHCDIKPDNILVEKRKHGEYQFYLADFSLVVEVQDWLQSRIVGGTLVYLSPEQTRAAYEGVRRIKSNSCIDRYALVCIYAIFILVFNSEKYIKQII